MPFPGTRGGLHFPEPANASRGPIDIDTMWGVAGPIAGTPEYLTYALDATPGQSGAAIFASYQENNRTVFLSAGLHQRGNYMQNQAVRFRPETLNEIASWRQ